MHHRKAHIPCSIYSLTGYHFTAAGNSWKKARVLNASQWYSWPAACNPLHLLKIQIPKADVHGELAAHAMAFEGSAAAAAAVMPSQLVLSDPHMWLTSLTPLNKSHSKAPHKGSRSTLPNQFL
jgi:hypothetical protein